MTQTVVPETPTAEHRVEAVATAGELRPLDEQELSAPRVSLRKRLGQLVDFHPAVGVADILFPGPHDRNRR